MEIRINTPLTKDKVVNLKAGDTVLLSGVIYTGRDAAHKRLIELLDKNEKLPIDVENEIIYYVGPSPAKPGQVIGSAGPTTSYRMDPYAPRLLDLGLTGMIGKGARNQEVIDAMKSIVKSEIIAYEDLGSEAIRRMEVKDMPLVVVIDSEGNNLYELGPKSYFEQKSSK